MEGLIVERQALCYTPETKFTDKFKYLNIIINWMPFQLLNKQCQRTEEIN